MRMYKAFDGGRVLYLATRQEARKYRSLGSVEVYPYKVSVINGPQTEVADEPCKGGFIRHYPSNDDRHMAEYYKEI